MACLVLAMCIATLANVSMAAEKPEVTNCATIQNDSERLTCYDAVSKRGTAQTEREPLRQLSSLPGAKTTSGATPLSERWELDPSTKQGIWVIRPYQPMFILPAVYSTNPDDSPQSPTHPLSTSVPLQATEAEFQLSFKAKAAENLFGNHADLWFAYTQQSQWQVYNGAISAPFRETNYSPELFMLFPVRYNLFGLTGRFVSLGVVHQSNGRADPLSRSWNRVYAEFGFERGGFALLVKPWIRIQDSADDDDNPDIMTYMGYGNVTAIYQTGTQEFTTQVRYNAGNLSTTDTWSFQIEGRLKGYVKLTTGYGETLIDYNWRQNTIGAGVLLVDWL